MQGVHEVLLAGHHFLIHLMGFRIRIAAGFRVAGDQIAGDFLEAERLAAIAREEAHLNARFGPAWRDYAARVHRWFGWRPMSRDDIPLIGRFWQSKVTQDEKKCVLFFVTVKVIDPSGRQVNQPAVAGAQ